MWINFFLSFWMCVGCCLIAFTQTLVALAMTVAMNFDGGVGLNRMRESGLLQLFPVAEDGETGQELRWVSVVCVWCGGVFAKGQFAAIRVDSNEFNERSKIGFWFKQGM